jgi:hypothetical protein
MNDYHQLLADSVTAHSMQLDRFIDYIEVGVLTGNSALAVLQTHRVRHATLIDNFSNTHCGETKSSRQLVEDRLIDYDGLFQIMVGDSRNVLPHLDQDYDIGFVDGEHTDSGCWCDMRDMLPLIRQNGHMFVDDLRNPESLTGIVERFASENDLNLTIHNVHNGVGELTRKQP